MAEQLIVLRAFETELTTRLFLVMAGVIELRRSLIDDILTSRKEGNLEGRFSFSFFNIKYPFNRLEYKIVSN